MFSESYIQKCCKYKEQIDDLFILGLGREARIEKEDHIHIPDRNVMKTGEVYSVVGITIGSRINECYMKGQPGVGIPMDKCVLVPEKKQLLSAIDAEIKNRHTSIAPQEYINLKKEEDLLDWYIRVTHLN